VTSIQMFHLPAAYGTHPVTSRARWNIAFSDAAPMATHSQAGTGAHLRFAGCPWRESFLARATEGKRSPGQRRECQSMLE
jgi:hypothetical protein